MLLLFFLLSGVAQESFSGTLKNQSLSPYFPDLGRAAVYQHGIDLQNPAVILSVALEPGYEDLAALANLRIGRGARVISLYVTNGEATPSDLGGESPFRVAGRRKEEAYHAISHIGGEAYFLNFPGGGVVSDTGGLKKLWEPDSVISRLVEVIETYRPDVILIHRDMRSERGETLRQSVLREYLLHAVQKAQGPLSSRSANMPVRASSWKVQRVFIDVGLAGQHVRVNVDARHPIWRKTYRALASEAEQHYESLRAQRRAWQERGDRSYTLLLPTTSKTIRSLDGGLTLVSPDLQNISTLISEVIRVARGEKPIDAVPLLSMALDSVDRAIAWRAAKLTNLDRRVLITWKGRLESLRYSLLEVDIDFEVSDSLITSSQLFYLQFKKLKANVRGGQTEILFPNVARENWVVNEELGHQFPFRVNEEYRILTPRTLQFNTPVATYGIDKDAIKTYFSFIIIHRDSLRERNFQYRKEIPLSVGPRFAAEIYTPLVYVTPNEKLIYRFRNFTRDGVYGDAHVEDSLVSSDLRPFRLSRKDSSVHDTLTLTWREAIPPGDYLLDLKISGETVGRFAARSFHVSVDTSRVVGLITALKGSPVGETLRRLRVPIMHLDPKSLKSFDISSLSTIIIDRDAIAMRRDLDEALPRLMEWVSTGGHLIAMPQYSTTSGDPLIGRSLSFRHWPVLDPESNVWTDASHPFLSGPNMIQPEDWLGWIFSRSRGSVESEPEEGTEVLIRAQESGAPLLVTKREGDGQLTFVALDLDPQLMNIHSGAYRLFANIVSYSIGDFRRKL